MYLLQRCSAHDSSFALLSMQVKFEKEYIVPQGFQGTRHSISHSQDC